MICLARPLKAAEAAEGGEGDATADPASTSKRALSPAVLIGGAVGGGLLLVAAVPAGVVTEMGPVVAPPGTVAVSCVAVSGVNAAAMPLNATAVTPPLPQ